MKLDPVLADGRSSTPSSRQRRASAAPLVLLLGFLVTGTAALAAPASQASEVTRASGMASEGVRSLVGPPSLVLSTVEATALEARAAATYADWLETSRAEGNLLPEDDPDVVRLRRIAARQMPFASAWNARASQWRWEINVTRKPTGNGAWCYAGGKIGFDLRTAQLSDDKVAMIMGHELAHALREHSREQEAKASLLRTGLRKVVHRIGGAGPLGAVAERGIEAASHFSGRRDETEATLIGMELAARAGYDPRAALALWSPGPDEQGRMRAGVNDTHPTHAQLAVAMQEALPLVLPLYERVSGR